VVQTVIRWQQLQLDAHKFFGMSGGNWKDLFKAAGQGNIALVRYHLQQGVDPNFQHAEYFSCPIFEAIRQGHLEVVRILVEEGNARIDVDEDLTDKTPLEVALEEGQHWIVDYLNKRLPPELQWKPQQVLVTGGNRGLGFAISQKLLSEGHRVVMTCRSKDDGERAIERLKSITRNNKADYLVGDLSTVASAKKLASLIAKEFPSVNVLIHNAGFWPTHRMIGDDGFELAFMVHYLGPYILTRGLADVLRTKGRSSRIIFVRDQACAHGRPTIEGTPYGKEFGMFSTYRDAQKCGMILFRNTARSFGDSQVRVTAVHPGRIRTELGNPRPVPGLPSAGLSEWCWGWYCSTSRVLAKPPSEGAVGPAWLASSTEAARVHGEYYHGVTPVESSADWTTASREEEDEWDAWTRNILNETGKSS